MEEQSKLFVPKRVPFSSDPMRAMVAEAYGKPYQALPSLEAAQAITDGVVILQGDDGGTIYAVCPAVRVHCDHERLLALLADLDAVIWGQPGAIGIFYEQYPLGSVVPGGMGGGKVMPDIWIHRRLVEKSLETSIRAVVEGQRESVKDTAEYMVALDQYLARRAQQKNKQ